MHLPWIDEDSIARESEHLFHYTQLDSVAPILRSGGLLARRFDTTNDASELSALREPLVPHIAGKARPLIVDIFQRPDRNFHGTYSDLMKVLDEDVDAFFSSLLRSMPGKPHLVCFSEHREPHHIENGILTLWRCYGGEAVGVALGFNTKKLIDLTYKLQKEKAFDPIYLDRVGYGLDHTQTRDRIEDFEYLPMIYAEAATSLIEGEIGFSKRAQDELTKFAILVAGSKHPDFQDEREVRLVVTDPSEYTGKNTYEHTRTTDQILVKCIEALEVVLVGPDQSQSEQVAHVKGLLRDAGLGEVKVHASRTPYRRT